MIKDARSGKSVRIPNDGRQCQFLEALSPDGSPLVGGRAVGGERPARHCARHRCCGRRQARPAAEPALLPPAHEHDRRTWIDSRHLLVIAQRYQPGAKVGRQLEELCTIPVMAAPTCATLQDLGPYERPEEDTNDPSIGPDVWLAHPLGQ